MNINNIINTLGFATTIGGFIYVGRKLQMLDELKKTADNIQHNLRVVTNHLIRHDANFDYTKLK